MTYGNLVEEVKEYVNNCQDILNREWARVESYRKNGHLDTAIRNYTEDLFKAEYQHRRAAEILDALENTDKEDVAGLLCRVMEDIFDRGFHKQDIRHCSTNEMDNITRRWKVEVEPKIYQRVLDWQFHFPITGVK